MLRSSTRPIDELRMRCLSVKLCADHKRLEHGGGMLKAASTYAGCVFDARRVSSMLLCTVGRHSHHRGCLARAASLVLASCAALAHAALLTPAATYTTGNSPRFVVTADFNNDGKPDLAVVNQSSSSVTIFLGKGNGSFTAGATLSSTG